MGRNVDLIRMCGLPTEIEFKGKKYNIEDQLRDYDIDDDWTNPEDGIWVLTIGDEDLGVKIKFKCSGEIINIQEDE